MEKVEAFVYDATS